MFPATVGFLEKESFRVSCRYQQIRKEITSSECHTKQRAAGLKRIFQSKQDYFTV